MTKERIRGIGVDAVAVERMDTRRMSAHVLRRLFHEREYQEAMTLPEERRAEYLASRFAAKEALVKALGTGFRGIAPRDIAVVVDRLGRPSITVESTVRQALHLDSMIIHLSMTHERSLALAFVVLEERDGSL
ncbi:MAG TPA: holo-ACP synthase [Sphaerochaetaceae bacterium]|nr:holo-ACP synthase [Sphaerochaetaceae bacterium]